MREVKTPVIEAGPAGHSIFDGENAVGDVNATDRRDGHPAPISSPVIGGVVPGAVQGGGEVAGGRIALKEVSPASLRHRIEGVGGQPDGQTGGSTSDAPF